MGPAVVVDDGDAGFSTTGAWTSLASTTARGGDMLSALRGTGDKSAIWEVGGLVTGRYAVYATWVRGSYATNAPYTVYDGTTNRGTTLVSQRNTPADLTADGSSWAFLLDVEVISGVLRIKLDNNANATIVADAIRIVRID